MNISVSLLLTALLASHSVSAHNGLNYEQAYARATPPNAVNSAAFMIIDNPMQIERQLISASSPVAQQVELHTVEKQGDVIKMRPVESITIPAQQATELKPGGYHIMLLGIKHPLMSGEKIQLTLTFANGEHKTLSIPIKSVQVGMQHDAMPKQTHSNH